LENGGGASRKYHENYSDGENLQLSFYPEIKLKFIGL
jgi:hypothetical protein